MGPLFILCAIGRVVGGGMGGGGSSKGEAGGGRGGGERNMLKIHQDRHASHLSLLRPKSLYASTSKRTFNGAFVGEMVSCWTTLMYLLTSTYHCTLIPLW